jgi:CheY-like chemotaxis protein
MKIDYNIIWVDDKIDTRPFKGVINKIEEFLSEQFFEVTIIIAENYEEFKEKYNQKIDYDLVITDLNLNESKGTDVIDFIRLEKNVLTEVFFYSANSEVNNTGLANSSRITFFRLDDHNLYISLQSKLEEVISLTITKFQHIVSMRGMIMHESSSLDAQMLKIIKESIKNNKIDFSELSVNIYDELLKLFAEKSKFVQEECKEKNNFNRLTKDTFIFSSKYKIDTLSQIIGVLELDDFSKDYQDEIISTRNKFAHAELEIDKNGREFFKYKKDGITFDEAYCKIIRKNIIKHKKNLDLLKNELNKLL